jgi:hypothetical protein
MPDYAHMKGTPRMRTIVVSIVLSTGVAILSSCTSALSGALGELLEAVPENPEFMAGIGRVAPDIDMGRDHDRFLD